MLAGSAAAGDAGWVPKLAAALRDRMTDELRSTLLSTTDPERLTERLVALIRELTQLPGGKALGDLAKVATARRVRTWVRDLPSTHRAAWIVEQLGRAAKLEWAEPAPVPSGPLALPRHERDKLHERLHTLWCNMISSSTDDPNPEELAETAEAALARLGNRYPALASRLLAGRFEGLTFSSWLEKQALADPEQIVACVERTLQLEWTASRGVGRARPFRESDEYSVGDRIAHPRYGKGTVIGTARARITVEFAVGVRFLVVDV